MAAVELASWLALGLSLILCVLVAVQTLRLERVERQFRALTRGMGPDGESMYLGEIVAVHSIKLDEAGRQLDRLNKAMDTVQGAVARSVQCVGLVRFNAFDDTGGEQSFALAMLDKRGDGLVMSSLHGRTATRFYTKPIKNGESHLTLSDEEQRALQQALGKR